MGLDAGVDTGLGASVDTGSESKEGIQQITSTGASITVTPSSGTGPVVNIEVAAESGFPGYGGAPPAIANAGSAGVALTVSRSDHTHAGVTSFNGAEGAITFDPTIEVASMTALAALSSAALTAGQVAIVDSNNSIWVLMTTAVATRTGVRIASSGLAGHQWVRQMTRNPTMEIQAAWVVDPTNSSTLASDDNTGADATHPLLTYTELSMRLFLAEIAQNTTVTSLAGNQQAGDNPTWTYFCRGQFMNFVGTPTIVYTSTVTSFTAAAVGTTAADDNEFGDTAVPGGSFTAAGALAKGVLLKRTNGTVIYAAVLKDLGSTTARVSQPANPANLTSTVAFAPGDTYELLQLPQMLSGVWPLTSNLNTSFTLFDWQVPATSGQGVAGILMTTCYVEKLMRFGAGNVSLGACCIDITGGGSFETGTPTVIAWQMCSFKGTGATLYNFSGRLTSEGTVTCWQGCGSLLENGSWNGGQMSMYDSSIPVIRCGTGGRWHALSAGVISGKNNTGVLARASEGSQILSDIAISTGNFYTAASTSAGNPIQAGSTTSTTQIPAAGGVDANFNAVIATG